MIRIIQKEKKISKAEFEIYSEKRCIGVVNCIGSIAKPTLKINGYIELDSCKRNTFELLPTKKLSYKRKIEGQIPSKVYILKINGIEVGTMFQLKRKTNFSSVEYNDCLLVDGILYKKYGIVTKEKRNIKMIFKAGEKQIAEIETSNVVENMMHNFDLYAIDDFSEFLSVIFAMYEYANVYWYEENGVQATKSIVKYNFPVTTDKYLVDKYNPNFRNLCK